MSASCTGTFDLLGFNVSKNTLFDYLTYLEDAFLVFLVPKQEQSLRKQAHNPRKLHVIDPGPVGAFMANPGRDVGRKLETAVYLEMRRRRKDLFYFIDGSEVDGCDGEGTMFINTCWSLADPDTRNAGNPKPWPSVARAGLKHEVFYSFMNTLPELRSRSPALSPPGAS